MKDKNLFVVHLIDTEGPLYESLRANFERIDEIFGINLTPSYETLEKLQKMQIPLDGREEAVKNVISGRRINYLSSWDQIDNMLDAITNHSFRHDMTDGDGNGWKYNWMCMSHAGISGENPRRRDMGYHNVFDHYREYLDRNSCTEDLVQWHYHALSITNDAHRAGSTYLNSSHIHDILCRSIIDRHWFPVVFRAGHNTIRPDSHWFLEQWIPFDFSNASSGFVNPSDEISIARYGDWRNAPKSWIPYHPSHDDHQIEGNCRRYIARCLSMDDREYSLSEADIKEAFQEADSKGAAILAFTNHDFRDMKPDIEKVREIIKKQARDFKDIKIKYATAIEAMRESCNLDPRQKPDLDIELSTHGKFKRLIVTAGGNVFGPQPYLALKTRGGSYSWQNLDFESTNVWSYSFDLDNLSIDNVASIGVAANSSSGVTEVCTVDCIDNKQSKVTLNFPK